MEMKDKIGDKLKRGALSCGSFTTAYAVMTLLFFVPYVREYGGVLVAAFLPLAFLLPFIVMPIVYSVMHRFNPLFFGRYHLFMPVSGVLASFFFVIAFSSTGMNVLGALSMFFGMTLFVSMLLIYRYCTFSVAARLAGDNIGKRHISHGLIALVGAFSAVCTMYGFYRYDPASMYVNSAFVLAAACITVAFAGYLATFNDVPVLGGKHVQSVKRMFVTFYGGIDRRIYFSSFALISAFLIIAALSLAHTSAILSSGSAFAVAFAVVGAFSCAYAVAVMFVKRRSFALVVTIASCLIPSAALFGVSMVVKHAALVIIPAVLCGIGGAFALRCMALRFLSIKPRVTSGNVYSLLSLTVCAAFAVALAVAAVAIFVSFGFAYGFGFGGLFAVVGLVLSVPRLIMPKKVKAADTDGEPVAESGNDGTSDMEITSEKENV